MEMDFQEIGQMFKIRKKNVIREKIIIQNYLLDYRSHIQLNWYGHVQKMEWCLTGRKRRKGRPRNSLMQAVTTGMREKRINNLE